jgi:hypothetical protein
MKKKLNKELLNEELKRFKLLNEYDFYVGEDYDDYDNPDNLILGEEGEENDLGIEDLPPDDSKTADTGVDAEAPIDGGDDAQADAEAQAGAEDIDMADLEGGDEEVDLDMTDLEGGDAEEAPADDEVELDVTQLVQGTEEAKASADMANQKLDGLMGALDALENKLNSMESITTKIDDLENQLEKRIPTPEEKLEMRSLSSYPYNLKLTDFWADKGGIYDVMGNNEEESEEKEYVLTQKDVDNDYSESSVRDSFVDDNEYEEEEF